MLIWLVLLCLVIIILCIRAKLLSPSLNRENASYIYAFLFLVNYIPLQLFAVYHSDISTYLNSLGLTLLNNENFVKYLQSLWELFLNFLQYTGIYYWYCFWASGFISLVITYDNNQHQKAYWSCCIGILNPVFFLLYHVSAEDFEYLALYAITFGIFVITWIKLNSWHDSRPNYIDGAMGTYNFFIFTETILTLKWMYYYEIHIFELLYYFFAFYFYLGILYSIALYFGFSYATVFDYLNNNWKDFQGKQQKFSQIERNMWEMCKIYALIGFFTIAMVLTYNLVEVFLPEIDFLKEILFIFGDFVLGHILLYPDDGDSEDFSQNLSNSFSVYWQILIMRKIVSWYFNF